MNILFAARQGLCTRFKLSSCRIYGRFLIHISRHGISTILFLSIVMLAPPFVAAQTQNLFLEVDRLDTVDGLPEKVSRGGQQFTIESIYKSVNIEISTKRDEVIKDLHPGRGYSYAELHSLHVQTADKKPAGDGWYVHALFLTTLAVPDPPLGIMFENKRESFAVFVKQIGTGVDHKVLRTTAHELGHALNLFHNDGDGDLRCCQHENGAPLTGRSIMNQTRCLEDNWTYSFSSAEKQHLLNHPKDRIQPGTNFKLGDCIAGHKQKC